MSTPVIATTLSLAMARSPLFITGRNNAQPSDTLNYMSLSLRIYSGVRTGTGTNNYSLSKNYSINEVINFEISDLVPRRSVVGLPFWVRYLLRQWSIPRYRGMGVKQ
jgi:hypothetical protein